ncbi:MAG: ATP-dependent DNA helicase RecG [Candidatus Omnitrophota bacterium]|nr:ATP-dependent DNA helicase RecG [Candidatus Omnitrophota bacterium]
MEVQSLRYLKGVGPRKEEVFKRLGINGPADFLRYYPFRYEDRTNFKTIKDLIEGEYAVIRARVMARHLKKMPYFRRSRVKNIYEIAVSDASATIRCTWFNQGYLADIIKADSELIIYGKPRRYDGNLKFIAPEFEMIEEGEGSLNIGRIVGVYHTSPPLTQKFLRKIIFDVLGQYKTKVADPLPFDIRRERNLSNIAQSLEAIHFPGALADAERARERFIFEELFFSQILVYLRKAKTRMQEAAVLKLAPRSFVQIKRNFPFTLTAAQDTVLTQIFADLAKPYPMHRLLQGDVGSGKTVVAAFALAACVDAGFQAAFMVPTEVLAYQHVQTLSEIFKGMPYRAGLLVSSLKNTRIAEVQAGIKSGAISIVVGTHALIQEEVRFSKLGLVVIDEQHKFGVAQRAMLPQKGKNPHYLVMSATPIPRSLALSLYGDLDLSVIDALPQARQSPETLWLREKKRSWMYAFLASRLAEGRQAYIIYPVIEESELDEVKSLEEMFVKLKKKFSSYRLGMFHGRLKAEEKLAVIERFRAKKIDMLVSTTVVEVGVNVENATVMIVENPERFGLAQLHQLRGRIRRSSFKPYFILISADQLSEEIETRLSIIVKTSDGFVIAEEDLKLRGPGDFFGQLQHGLPALKIANPLRDMELLAAARVNAYNIIKRDPDLREAGHRMIREHLDFWFKAQQEEEALKSRH